MRSVTNADSSADRPSTEILQNPWTQAILTGALTLIPVRAYPRWVRRCLLWTPPLVGGIAGSYLSVNPAARGNFLKGTGTSQPESVAEQSAQQRQSQSDQQVRAPNALGIIAVGVSTGAALFAVTAAVFWADEKLERGLRRLKVPYPRIVMAIGAGAITWLQETKEQQRDSIANS